MLANKSVRQRSRSPIGLWLLLVTLFILPLWLSYSASPQVAIADQSNASAVLLDVPEKSPNSVQSQSEAQSEELNASDDTSDRSKEGHARPDEGLPAAVPVHYDASDGSKASDASSATRQGSDVYCLFLPLLTGGSGTLRQAQGTTQSQVPVPEPVEGEEGGAGFNCITSDQPIEAATILRSSPSNGEDGVAVTRETIIEFSDPLDPDSVTNAAISARFGGNTLATRLHISPNKRTVTLFYNEPLPASARVRVTIDGEQLLDANGNPVDVDGDGSAGGSTTIDFDTLSLTVIEGTSVCGRVFASELDTSDRGTSVNVPLQGVTITVDGMEDTLRTTTDNKGNFCLDPAPAGRFFVHIDGRTATNGVPEGTYYPFVGKAWESTIGQQTNVGTAHLPLVPEGTLQPVSQTEDTTINLAPSVLEQFPEFADVSITVPANSLYADDGTRGGSVGIAPVPPDRLPGQLPEELNFPVVITVQTDGATNFDQPAPVCFPNLPDPDTGETLAAGEKSALFSFNHDTGGWEIAGSMTVSEDGTLICADEGVGVRAPGWHGSQPGTGGSGGGSGNGGGSGGGNGGGGSGGGNGGPSCPSCNPEQVESEFKRCVENTVVGALPVIGCRYSIWTAIRDAPNNSIGRNFWNAFVTTIGCIATPIGAGLSTYTCIHDFAAGTWNNFKECTGSSCSLIVSSNSQMIHFNQVIERDIFVEQLALWDAGGALFDAFVGNPKWGDIDNEADNQLAQDFYIALNESLADSTPGGLIITTSERQSLLQLPLPSTITTADAEALIDRMNLIANEQFPQAEIDAIRAAGQQLEETALELEARGWTTTLDTLRRGPQEIGNTIVTDLIEAPHFYKVTNLSSGTILRGQLGSGGTFSNQILAPNTLYEVSYVDPSTLQTASTVFLSGENGSNTEIAKALLTESDSPDSDGDGLTDEAEDTIGTNANNPDTDEDGIADGAEVQQGTNPLDGLAVTTGIIGTVDTQGTALDVCALNDIAAVADSEAGVSVFNVFNGMNPSIIAQVDTQGNAQAVACAGDFVAVADGEAGLAIVDISDPPAARVIYQINLDDSTAKAVAVGGNVAYVGTTSGQIVTVELDSGAVLGAIDVSEGVEDLSLAGDLLVALGHSKVSILSVADVVPQLLGTMNHNRGLSDSVGSRIFNANPVVYLTHFDGYDTIDISDPTQPTQLGRSTEVFGTYHGIADNGSGTVVTSYSRSSTDWPVAIFDGSDPTNTDQWLTEYQTPGSPADLTIYNGLAYVADSRAGMQVINYLAYDSQGVPPTIALASNVPGNDVLEGSLVRVSADVSDDVQVRNVEFYLDGNRIAIDGTFPFEYRFPAPSLSTQSTFTVTARAKDTGGNSTESNVLTVNVLPDTEPPSVAIVEPVAGEFFTRLDRGIPVTVSATDNVRVADLSFKVDGTPVSANRVSLNTYEVAMPATIGTYQISVVATDGAGLSAESTAISVEVIDFEVGDQLEAKIDYSGDLDRYAFQAEAGQVLFFDWQSEFNSSWQWQLVDSAGTVIFNQNLRSDPGAHTLSLGGTYTMIIGNQNGQRTGEYRLQLLQAPPPDEFTIAIGDVVSAGFPASGAGHIEQPGAVDLYTFQAEAGQRVFFDWQVDFNDGWRWQVIDSAGTVIFDKSSLSDDPGAYLLSLGGAYTMIISAPQNDDPATYQFQLLQVPQPDEFTIAIGDMVSDGVPDSGAGNIEQPAALDLYTFQAEAGQVVYFDLQAGANSNWEWQLTDSTGAVIFNRRFSDDPGAYTLSLGGAYTMRIGNEQSDNTGTYQVQLLNVPPPQEFSIAIGDVVSDGVPEAGAGNIEEARALDAYTFEATAGLVYFDLQAGSNSNWRWQLADEAGNVIFNRTFSADAGAYTLELGSTYTMIIGNLNSDDTGTYQFQLLAAPEPDLFGIALGDVVSNGVPAAGAGNLEVPAAQDIYTFNAPSGELVFFDLQTGANEEWQWQLEDSDGTSIFNQSFSSDPGTYTLEVSGTYTVTVSNLSSDETGTYRFQLWDVPPPEEFSIAIGDVVSAGTPEAGAGNIETPGALDRYTFQATAGQVVFFDWQSSESSWEWQLVDSAGTVIFNQSLSSDPGAHTLELGGTYTMIIGNQSSDQTGTYRFRLWDVPPPEEFSIAIGDVVSNGVPEAGAGNIETPGALDRYTFSATAGQVVFFDWQAESSSTWRWKLEDSEGTVIFNQAVSNDPGTHILSLGGTYTMIVGNQNSDETGSYQFELRGAGQSNTFQINIGDVVSNGVPAPGAGNIEEPGSLDTYTFEATAGQVVFFDSQSESKLTPSWPWQLVDSAGTVIFEQSLSSDPGLYILSLGGTYTMIIGNQNSDETGSYRFQLWDVPPPEEFNIAIGDVVSDGIPESGAGNIETPGASDRYTFEAEAGQVVFFDSPFEFELSLHWQLVDSAGTVIFNQSSFFDAGAHTLSLGGTYTMTIGNQNSDDTGTYQFQLLHVPPPEEFNIAIGDVVSDGVPAPGAGNIEEPGALDIYTFSATAGQEVFFDWQGESSFSLRWKLEDSEGTAIFEQSVYNDPDPGTHILELGGTYTMTVGNQSNDETGTYQFELRNPGQSNAFQINIGDVVSDGVPEAGAGHIEEPGSLDRYTFSATAGQVVFFDSQSSESNWRWQLVDSTGTVIFNRSLLTDPGAHTLSLGGTYTMIIGNQSSDATGTYRFQLWDVPSPEEFNIAIGDVVSNGVPESGAGNIESPGTLDLYTFSATAGQEVFFDWQAESSSTWRWKLEDSEGTVIFNQGVPNDPGTHILELGGTYTMTIGNQNSDETGSYQFELRDPGQSNTFQINIGDVVSDGVPAPGAGNIEEPGVLDIYTFEATAGQVVYFDLQEGFNDDWRWILEDSQGTVIFNERFRNDPGAHTLELGGTYTMTIGNQNSDHTGTYQIQLLAFRQR